MSIIRNLKTTKIIKSVCSSFVLIATHASISSTNLLASEIDSYGIEASKTHKAVKVVARDNRERSLKEIQIPSSNLFTPNNVGKIQLSYSDGDFFVSNKESKTKVNRYELSKELRDITSNQLEAFLEVGYLSVKKVEGDYSVQSHLRLRGGGPIFGIITGIGVVAGIFTSAVVSVVVPPAAPGAATVAYTLAASSPATITAAFLAPTP